eukprot:m.748928 g.748928  ORF g.748928 m.748928 type:complete len:53 (+) comp23151_c1_seq2:866-1024(+)
MQSQWHRRKQSVHESNGTGMPKLLKSANRKLRLNLTCLLTHIGRPQTPTHEH